MITDNEGINLIKNFEGFSPKWYKDANGESIGYGHFRLPGDNFQTVNIEQATALLNVDIKKAENIINKAIKIPINQNQFNALVSFAYNTGKGTSTLYDLINQKKPIETILQWWKTHYITSQNKIIPNLIKRRKTEAELFAKNQNNVTIGAALVATFFFPLFLN